MILNKVYNENSILEAAMQASILNNQVIQNNIANAELPNFKKSYVSFNDVLQDAVEEYKNTGEISISNVTPSVIVENKELSYRLDGNNVDIEEEMVALYTNDSRYSVMASSVVNNYKSINLVLNSK